MLHYWGDNSYLCVNKRQIYKFKGINSIPFDQFCLRSIIKDFTKDEMKEITLNGIVYDVSVGYVVTDVKEIFNIYKYFTKNHNINEVFISESDNYYFVQFWETINKKKVKHVSVNNEACLASPILNEIFRIEKL